MVCFRLFMLEILNKQMKLGEIFMDDEFENATINQLICEKLLCDEVKVKLCNLINDSVNIPFINESTEQKVFESIWDIVEVCIREQLDKELNQ